MNTDRPPNDTLQMPFNTTAECTAFTVTSRYGAACPRNLIGGGHNYPMTSVLVLTPYDNKELTTATDVPKGSCPM